MFAALSFVNNTLKHIKYICNTNTSHFREYDIDPILVGKLENLNQEHCGSSRVRFVLGGQKAPEGGFPFIVTFTQV